MSLKCDFFLLHICNSIILFFITNNFFIFLDNDIVKNPGEALNDDPRGKNAREAGGCMLNWTTFELVRSLNEMTIFKCLLALFPV